MYAIREVETMRFFYGMDNGFYPPRPKVSVKNHVLRYYNTLEEAQEMLNRLGNRFEIVALSYSTLGDRNPRMYRGTR